MGVISNTAAAEIKSLDVTAPFLDDMANASARFNSTQYRLEYTLGTNGDQSNDEARIRRNTTALTIEYWVD